MLTSRHPPRSWFTILTRTGSQPELVGHFGRDVFEGDGRSGDPPEARAVERQPGQFAHLDLPLDQAVLPRVAVHAEQHVALALLVVAVVGVQNPPDLLHHVPRLHGGRGLHAPGEAQGAGFRVPALLSGLAGQTPATAETESTGGSVREQDRLHGN